MADYQLVAVQRPVSKEGAVASSRPHFFPDDMRAFQEAAVAGLRVAERPLSI